MPPALTVDNLTKRYAQTEALRGVSFQVQQGEIFALLGPNGAGKTTTLECIAGLRRPDSGSIHVAEIDALAHPAQSRQKIGVQLQSTALQDKITPRQALHLFASFYEKSAPIAELLAQFNLTEKSDATFDTLSAGQRQRLAIALALVHQPEIVFLDEPTAGLDPAARHDLHTAIAHIKSTGRTLLLTTHYIEEAEKLCDRVAIIDHGKIVAIGTPAELIASSHIQPHIRVQTARPLTPAQASSLTAVTNATLHENRWRLSTTATTQTILSLVHLLESEKNDLLDLQIHQPTLEDVFLEKTSNRLPEKTGNL